MKYWKMRLTCQSPVHIGSGETYKKNQYVYEEYERNAKVYFLNELKWAIFLDKEKLMNHFADEISKNFENASTYDFLRKHFPQKINQVIQDLIKAEVLSVPLMVPSSKVLNDIHTFIKDSEGRMYIPGSSLKGAFRTAILFAMIKKERKKYDNYWNDIATAARGGEKRNEKVGNVLERLEKEVFIPIGDDGERNMVNSYFRGLTVGDSTGANQPGIIVQKADLGETEYRPHTIPLWRECMAVGDTVTFTLGIEPKIMEKVGISDAKGLIACLQNFVDFQCDLLWKSFNDTDEIQEMQKTDCLLGGGAGFLSKTMIYALAPSHQSGLDVVKRLMAEQFKRGHHNQGEHISPHTLKLAKRGNSYQVMGMCKLEVMEELC